MARLRVTQEFALAGDPPTQPATDRMSERLRSAAPDAGVAVKVGIGRIQVELTFDAESEERAIDLARTTSASVLGGEPIRVVVAGD